MMQMIMIKLKTQSLFPWVNKGNIGDQNYDLPDDLDLNVYRSVVIWCKRFGVNFAVAPLKSS